MAPSRLPINDQEKLRSINGIVVCFRKRAIGIIANDPVTSSRFKSKIITKPVGNISAPTISKPVCVAPVKASVVAKPN